MKPFIYLSVLLIVAGSAFGLSDYFRAKNNGTLAKLYKEDTPELPVTVEQPAVSGNVTAPLPLDAKTNANITATPAKTVAVKKIKKEAKPRKLSFKLFSRGDEIRSFEPPPVVEEPALEKPVVVPAVAEEPVKKEQPEVKEEQPVKTVEPVKESRPSLTKLFSRAKPPRLQKKAEVKPVSE